MSVTGKVYSWTYFQGMDDDIDSLPLMGAPWAMLLIVAGYTLFVLKIGPRIMEKRKALDLTNVLVVYNFLQVINCAFMAYQCFMYFYTFGFIMNTCKMADNSEEKRRLIRYSYLYVLTKIADLLDTVFFVLRKKYSQITFLHLYHHTIMVVATWFGLKYDISEAWIFLGLANSVIHCIMYTYYGLSAFGPRFQKYLWWKKYLTRMQLIQFVLILAHLIVQTCVLNCPISRPMYWVGVFNGVLFIYLFMDFYLKSYSTIPTEVDEEGQNVVKMTAKND